MTLSIQRLSVPRELPVVAISHTGSFLLAAAAVQCTCSGDPLGEGFAFYDFFDTLSFTAETCWFTVAVWLPVQVSPSLWHPAAGTREPFSLVITCLYVMYIDNYKTSFGPVVGSSIPFPPVLWQRGTFSLGRSSWTSLQLCMCQRLIRG